MRINSGPTEAESRLEDVRQEDWRILLAHRRMFVRTGIPHDCRQLLRFVDDGEKMCGPLGFDSIEAFIRDGLNIDPKLVEWAIAGLRTMKPDEPIPFAKAVEVGKVELKKRGGQVGNSNAAKVRDKNEGDSITFVSLPRGSTSAAYWRARLERDAPADDDARVALERLNAGLISANRAAIEAGLRDPPDPAKVAARELRKCDQKRRSAVLEEFITSDVRGVQMAIRRLSADEQGQIYEWLGEELGR